MYESNAEALQLHVVYKKSHENLYQYYKSHENPEYYGDTQYSPLYPVSIVTGG